MSKRLATLNAKIAALSAEAGRLEDVSRIKRLQRAYGYYIDKGYWDEATALFAEDATLESGVDGVYAGKARIRAYLIAQGGGNSGPGLPYGQLNHRMQLQPVITLADDGLSAKGRWRELALLGRFKTYAAWGDGIHENSYAKEDGVWKIARLHYFPNFVAPYEGGWVTLEPVEDDWPSETARQMPPDRPPTIRYAPYPAIYAPPFHYPNPGRHR